MPAKLGDLYRAYLLRQEIKVSVSRGVGTVLAERLLDLIVLLLLFIPAIIISLHENLPSQLRLALEITLGAVILGIVALFALRQMREPLAKLVPLRFRSQYYSLQEGILGSFRRLPLLTGLTIGVWLCEALRFFFVALALSLIPGNLVHILAASVFIGLGEALLTVVPTTGGGVGLVEGGMVAMIALFYQGADVADHTAAAIVLDRWGPPLFHKISKERFYSMSEHAQIELYVTVGNDQQNASIEALLEAAPVDAVVAQTLQAVHVTQPVMLTLLITDNEGIRDMNKQYREQDKPTDVLSFPLLDAPLVQAPPEHLWTLSEEQAATQAQQPAFVTPPDAITNLGDVVMSWPTLTQQAADAGHSSIYELLYLLSHGVLHLVGYDDHSEAGYRAMVGIQQSVLQAVGQKA